MKLVPEAEFGLGLIWVHLGATLPQVGDQIDVFSEGWPAMLKARVTSLDPDGPVPIEATQV